MTDAREMIAILVSFVLAILITPALTRAATARRLVDTPNVRSSHVVPVPRIGGVAIFLGTLAGFGMLNESWDRDLLALLLAGLLLFVSGVWDDLMTLNPLQKYLPQLVAAGIAALALDRHVVIEIPGSHVQVGGELSTLLIVLWIVAIINFVNFMDGLDGLVAGTSAVIAITASLLTVQANFWVPVLAASLIGFLAWNASPASIFMGDGGSQFIGYSLAVAVLLVPQHDANLTIGAVLLSPFLVDTTYTLVKRAIARKNLLQAHREHVYQRLAQGAVTHRSMSNFHYVIGAFSGAAAVLLVDQQGAGRWIGAGLLAAFYVAYILIAELVDSGRSPETRRQAR